MYDTREPRLEGHGGRRALSAQLGMLLAHLLFAVSWFVVTPDLVGSLLVWFVFQVGVWAGYHRYFTHRSYKTHPWFELVLAVVGCLASQGGLFWWVSLHRHHHRTADTEEDFHSPVHGFWRSYMGWLFRNEVDERIKGDVPPDLYRPHLLWVERNDVRIRIAYAASLALLFGLPGVLNYYIVPLVLCWHTSLGTNYFAHAIGSHPAECPPRGSCAARNNALVALLDLGEGWHNNHHAHPTYAHSGFYRWYQLDITYLVLLVLEQLGVIWDVKRRPRRPGQSQPTAVGLAAA
ncbi:MAG: acyl-CoA desaturase [Deltaproteobacteria bacterium]|nr:MAG: acyl-CoA desaturase [Deltaproteobacteria bacterium]